MRREREAIARRALPLLLPFLFLLLVGSVSGQASASSKQEILARLLSNYDAGVRPPVKEGAAHSSILVTASLLISGVKWEPNGEAELDVWLREEWEDSRLKYVAPAGNVDEVLLPGNKAVWTPDTYFTNANDEVDDRRRAVYIEPSGHVRQTQRRKVRVATERTGTPPFSDRRELTLRLSSYAHRADDLVYLWANSPPFVVPVEAALDENSPLELIETTAGDCVGNYTIGVYGCIDANVVFGTSACRVLSSPRLLVPLLLVLASWLQLWLPGSWSVPRSISAAGPFLLLAGWLLVQPEKAACWPLVCLFFTFLSFVEYALVIFCGVRKRRLSTTGNELGQYYDGALRLPGSVSQHERELVASLNSPSGQGAQQQQPVKRRLCGAPKDGHCVDVTSRLLFPIAFLLYLVIALVAHLAF